ncbi:hypothetical protein BN1708_020443, partial [Verticillium longisporum]
RPTSSSSRRTPCAPRC